MRVDSNRELKYSDTVKKICFVVPTLKRGGLERVVSVLSNYLVQHEFDVTIISIFEEGVGYEVDKKIKIEFLIDNYTSTVFNKIKIFKLLKQLISNSQPDLVIGFGEVFNPFTILAAKLNKVPVIISDRNNPELKQPFVRRIFRKLTYPNAEALIAQTERAKSIFEKRNYNKNIVVLPNPLKSINNSEFHPEKKAIIHVGSLTGQKNQDDIIRVFKKIGDKEWQVYLVGEGRRRNILEELIGNLELEEQVHLVGQVPDVDEWLKKGSIFVFPSIFEGFPNALNEAMAFPLACVAYDCPTGVRELIEDGKNGYMIPLKDIKGLQSQIEKLMSNEELRLSFMKSSFKNRNKYSLEKIGKRFIAIINQSL